MIVLKRDVPRLAVSNSKVNLRVEAQMHEAAPDKATADVALTIAQTQENDPSKQ